VINIREGDFLSALRMPANQIIGTATAKVGMLNVCSGTSSDYTVTLPTVAESRNALLGVQMAPITSLSKLITIDGNGSETIDGELVRYMRANEIAIFRSDGAAWAKLFGKPNPFYAVASVGATAASSGVATKMPMSALADNSGFFFSNSNTRFEIQRKSLYTISVIITYNAISASGDYYGGIYINGSEIMLGYVTNPGGGSYPRMNCTTSRELSQGEYVEAYAVQYSGASQNALATMSVVEIGSW